MGLTRLPNSLPEELEELYCYDCTGLSALSDSLPSKLLDLYCNGCVNLTSLPSVLQERLRTIYCKDCVLLVSEDPRALRHIDINANRKRRIKVEEMKRRLLQREHEKWVLMCMGLRCSRSPMKFLCVDILQIIQSHSNEYLKQEYTQNVRNIIGLKL